MVKKKSKLGKSTSALVVGTNVSATVDKLKKQSSPLLRVVENFTIKSKEDQTKMVTALKKLDEYAKEAKVQQSAFVDPAKQIIENSKVFFKPFLDSVEEAKKLGKQKIFNFINGRLEAAEQVNEKFSKGKIKKLSTAVSQREELEDNDNTRKIWTLVIKKPNLIPRKYLEPNETLIREDLKKGKKVPGCDWVQKVSISI